MSLLDIGSVSSPLFHAEFSNCSFSAGFNAFRFDERKTQKNIISFFARFSLEICDCDELRMHDIVKMNF